MKQEKFDEMVGMLLKATEEKKIQWVEDTSANSFSAKINGCAITIRSIYDVTIDEPSYSLSLLNTSGVVFATYSFDETADKDNFGKLKRLYFAIRDFVYHITESENMIMQGLEDLLGQD